MDLNKRIEQIQELPPERRLESLRELKGELEDGRARVESLIDDTLEEMDGTTSSNTEAPASTEVEEHLPSGSLDDTVHADSGLNRETGSVSHAPDYLAGMSYEQLWRQPTQYIYQRVNELAEQAYTQGSTSNAYPEEIANLYEAVNQKREDIREGVYTTTDEIVNQLDTATRIIRELMGAYRT